MMTQELVGMLVGELILSEAERPNGDRANIWQDFLDTVGRNDDAAVIATEKLFFAMQHEGDGEVYAALLRSRELKPRPAAILLARMWHTGKLEALDIEHPQRFIVPLFRKARDQAGEVLMWKGWWAYEALRETGNIVFRGSHDRRADRNPSWTLNIASARYFAGLGGNNPEPGRIYMAKIDKPDVLAVFNGVTEFEVVVDPRGLREMQLIEFAGMPLSEPTLTMRTF